MKNSMQKKDLSAHTEGAVYQVSLLQGLLYGDYHGSVTIKALKAHGNTGIGTFDRLNGELIMLDGAVYRAAADGSVEPACDGESTPFAVVASVSFEETMRLQEIPDYKALCQKLDAIVAKKGSNRFCIIRIDGLFHTLSVRSVRAQSEPYLPLTEVMRRDQTFFDYESIAGTLVGVYCPPYMAGMNAVGWHLHFLSKDKTKGGHVLDAAFADATLSIQSVDRFEMQLPKNKGFDSFNFTVDQSKDVKKIETK